jgi:parvulin-like peptidyl-prolyl isomerase
MQTQKRALLDDLIVRRLVLQEADRHNVLVGIDEVEAAYQKTRAGWQADELDAVLEAKDVTAAELKGEIRDSLMVSKYFREHVFARVAVTDEEIAKYVEAHPEIQVVPEQVRALQIVVKTDEKAREVVRELRDGMAFEEAAAKYSLSPEAKSGGDLGFFSRDSMPSIFDQVCFNLRPGEVSKIVASDFGHHIFKVVEKRPEALKPAGEVRDEVEDILRRRKERVAQEAKLAELRKAAAIVINEKELLRVD